MARYCLRHWKQRPTTLRRLQARGSKAGGRPPSRPRCARLSCRSNRDRDMDTNQQLVAPGWAVVRVWELKIRRNDKGYSSSARFGDADESWTRYRERRRPTTLITLKTASEGSRF